VGRVLSLLDYTPFAAIGFGVPQFLPQIRKLRATGDTAGVSWSWAALTTVNNAAWIEYFASSGYWTALVAACSVTALAGALTVMLLRRRRGGAAGRRGVRRSFSPRGRSRSR
jgi:hypothetical protein